MRPPVLIALCVMSLGNVHAQWRDIPLKSAVSTVQPMTGIVLWETNESVATAPIQLEYAYFRYDQVVDAEGQWDWSELDATLDRIAGRGHQAIIRWHDTYVGKATGVPKHIKSDATYRETVGKSEGKKTSFPDWTHEGWREFLLNFFTTFAKRYDNDARIAFVQVGFGLWAEYHIYDGPMELGKTFPSQAYQSQFLKHIHGCLRVTPWMISVDAAGEHSPLHEDDDLLTLRFGLFDDSFNHRRHAKENEPNWNRLGRQRWKLSPAGGEFSFFEKRDQSSALAPKGPHGETFERQASRFHISFMIGDDQPSFQPPNRIREAGMALGYRFRVTKLEAASSEVRIAIANQGIAPIYFDAYPTIDGIPSSTSLKGLLPGQLIECAVAYQGEHPEKVTISSPRLVKGQQIQFDADCN